MPFYKFKCNACEKDVEKFWSMQVFEKSVENSIAKEPCECGGALVNQIGLIGMGLDIYKNDPRSNQYWKKGKTNAQVADVIAKKDGNPY